MYCTALAAGAVGAATGAFAAAGGSSRLFIPDHAAQQQTRDQHEHGDQSYIDEICGKPRERFDHFL